MLFFHRPLGYILLSRIGEGATSEVWDATHSATGRVVAVKVSRHDVQEAAVIAARMQTAWYVGRGLRHPHLVATLEGGLLPDGRAWLAMERLIGHDLQSELDARGRIEPARAVHIVRQVVEALHVLHRRGAVHRDVKPENVFMCTSGRYADHVKLIDLGVLALATDDPARAHEDTGRLILGTPLYLAPEMARGARPNGRTDLYAVGAVLYHLLAGRPPFDGEDPTDVVRQHVEEAVPDLAGLAPALPAPLYDLVANCLEKAPEARPADAAAMLAALADVADALASGPLSASLRRAVVPAVPAAGLPADWRHLHSVLARYVGLIWVNRLLPPSVADALDWTQDARLRLETALAVAEQWRERADGMARVRIEAQTRLDAQHRDLAHAIESATDALRGAHHAIDLSTSGQARIDEGYRKLVAQLAAPGELPLDGFEPGGVQALRGPIRTAVTERNECDRTLARARLAEREAAEQLALLLAEEVEIENASQELRLTEQDEERRAELQADADAALTAQRAYENACLQLYGEYVEQAPLCLRDRP